MKRFLTRCWSWLTCWWGHSKVSRRLQVMNRDCVQLDKVYKRLRRILKQKERDLDDLRERVAAKGEELAAVSKLLESQQDAFDQLQAKVTVQEITIDELVASHEAQIERRRSEATIEQAKQVHFQIPPDQGIE